MKKIFLIWLFLLAVKPVFADPGLTQALIGPPENAWESQIKNNGAFEPFPESWTVTPLLEVEGTQQLFQDANPQFFLEGGFLPIANIVWNWQWVRFSLKAFSTFSVQDPTALVRYKIQNKSAGKISAKLHLLFRSQDPDLTNVEYSDEGQHFIVNKKAAGFLSAKPEQAGFFVCPEQTPLETLIQTNEIGQIHTIKNPKGKICGVLTYEMQLEPKQNKVFALAVPGKWNGTSQIKLDFRQSLLETEVYWRQKMKGFQLEGLAPNWQESIKSVLTEALILRDEPGHYPQEFAHIKETQTWQTLQMAEIFLRFGFFKEAREDLEAIANQITGSGEIPVFMDDVVLTHSTDLKQYQLLGRWVAETFSAYQTFKDKKWLAAQWPHIKSVLTCLKRLREGHQDAWYGEARPEMKKFYGLLPASRALDLKDLQAQHYYEDNLWALRAFKDGWKIAELLEDKEMFWLREEEISLRRAILNSIEATSSGEIHYLPVSVESREFSPRAWALVFWPAEEVPFIPALCLQESYQKLQEEFQQKKISPKMFEASSGPVIRALIRQAGSSQGRSKPEQQIAELIWEMLRFRFQNLFTDDFFRKADFVMALRDSLVYESRGKLVLGAGLDFDWITSKSGLHVQLPTDLGEASYQVPPPNEIVRS